MADDARFAPSPPDAFRSSADAALMGGDGAARIVTPAGSTIEAEQRGGYRVCDPEHHCTHVDNLWQAQQLVQWAEVHHRSLDQFGGG